MIPSWLPTLGTLLPGSGRANFTRPSRMALSATCSRTPTPSTSGRDSRCFKSLRTTSANSFTTLLTLFNDTQGNKESIHEFCSQFEGHLGALSRPSVAIPSILQVMLFLRAMHTRYGDLLTQFALKQKDLSLASIDSVVSDAKFMDEFTVVGAGGKPKLGAPSPSPRSPAAATVVTNWEGKRYRTPFEWLASYDPGSYATRWRKSLGGKFIVLSAMEKRSIIPSTAPPCW